MLIQIAGDELPNANGVPPQLSIPQAMAALGAVTYRQGDRYTCLILAHPSDLGAVLGHLETVVNASAQDCVAVLYGDELEHAEFISPRPYESFDFAFFPPIGAAALRAADWVKGHE